jgi:hypothetical protein
MVNEIFKLDSYLRYSIWFMVKGFLEKSKIIEINLFTLNWVGAMKNSFILILYVRVHILSGSLLYMYSTYSEWELWQTHLCEWHMNKVRSVS